MSIYVINRQIHFDNEAFLLYAATAPSEALRIGAIASRCLTLLLQANGNIVSKRDLMSGAWGEFGLEVTDNSLAQVVRQLRVALEKLQADPELIVTVPRLGYRSSAQVELLDTPAPTSDPLPAPSPDSSAVAPAPSATPTASSGQDWPRQALLGLCALLCCTALFLLPSLLRPGALPLRPFVESQVEEIEGITVHSEAMPTSALRPDSRQLAGQARRLAMALGLGDANLHLYRFADRSVSLGLLCQGPLTAPDSQCLGLQPNE